MENNCSRSVEILPLILFWTFLCNSMLLNSYEKVFSTTLNRLANFCENREFGEARPPSMFIKTTMWKVLSGYRRHGEVFQT